MSSTASTSDLGNKPLAPQDTPRDINMSKSAVAQWQKLGDQISVLDNLRLGLYRNIQSEKAFFRISAQVALKASTHRHSRIYLFVPPEHIKSLTLEDNPETQHKLGSGTVCLRFSLSTPPTLFGPKLALTPKNKAAGDRLDALRALASQLSFSVYTNPSTKLLPRQLLLLCEAASQHQLRSITALADPANLYDGEGGQAVEVEGLAGELAEAAPISDGEDASSHYDASSPPSDSKLALSPQYSGSGPSRKRRRVASGNPRALETPEIPRDLIEDICARVCDSRLADLKRDMTQQLEGLGRRVIDHTEKRLGKLRKDVMLKTGVIIDQEIEGLKSELQDSIRHEVGQVDEKCWERVSRLEQQLENNS